MKRILICDDSGKIVRKWERELGTILRRLKVKHQIEPLSEPALFWEQISVLEKRRKEARRGENPQAAQTPTRFDSADIVFVDYDLIGLSQHESRGYITAESVAYLCRCYSRCGLIVALNQFGNNPFDLTLKGHPESYADLNLGSEQLANPGLWCETWTGFRPWYWPVLPQAQAAFERRASDLAGSLDANILEYLGFPEGVARALPRVTAQYLGPKKKPEGVTFRDFVLRSGNGLERKDKPLNPELMARIAAARLGKWLERLVLPGQDILVDAPHLVSRFSSLLKGNIRSLPNWNKNAAFTLSKTRLRSERIDAFRFARNDWLSRPAWFWKELSNCEEIEEVKNPWISRADPGYVFCEDASGFLPRKAAREFVADLPSSFVRRYVVSQKPSVAKRLQIKGVEYTPSVRFSL